MNVLDYKRSKERHLTASSNTTYFKGVMLFSAVRRLDDRGRCIIIKKYVKSSIMYTSNNIIF